MSEGDIIAGRYRLEGRLGFGGMSTVHLAFDMRLERRVAVKLLAEHLADDPTFVSRFQREAQAAARLVHPNIVQVFDSGLDEHSGRHFIVMEYIEGSSCAEILRDDGWVQVDEAVAIIEQACEGLHYAHRHGVVHRDVKPGNLLRSREGGVKLADFGIAKATEQSSITQVGSVLGTAAYLAPEQARGEEAGPRADLYALGVVAYQLISGRLPYEATSLTELALKQQREEPPMLDTLVAAVGPELAEAVALALALDTRERYQTAREMGRGISDGADGISPLEVTARRSVRGAGRSSPGNAGHERAEQRWRRGGIERSPDEGRRRSPAAAAGADEGPGGRREAVRRRVRGDEASEQGSQAVGACIAWVARAWRCDRGDRRYHRAGADQGRAAQRRLHRRRTGFAGAETAGRRKHQVKPSAPCQHRRRSARRESPPVSWWSA